MCCGMSCFCNPVPLWSGRAVANGCLGVQDGLKHAFIQEEGKIVHVNTVTSRTENTRSTVLTKNDMNVADTPFTMKAPQNCAQ